MFSNFLKSALRNIFRHKTYVIINILGLAVGFACSLLIFLFVIHELSFDKFNEKYDRIYRLYLVGKMGETEFTGAWTAAPTARTFVEEFPEVETAVRMQRWDEALIRIDDRKFIESDIALADSGFFDMFSLKLLEGDPQRALAQPHAVVLTASTAKKYFNEQEAVGQHLRIGNDSVLFTITGVMEDVPENSHFEFDLLISFLTHPRANDDFWLSNSFSTYLLLRKDANAETLESKLPVIIEKYIGPQVEKSLGMDLQAFADAGNRYGMFIQPLSDIHLNTDIVADFKRSSDRKYIYIFSGIAFIILIVAGINYMNLSTARSARRSREVGLRKVVGSSKGMLIWQFLLESILLTILSTILAILLVELLLPLFNTMLQINLKVGYFSRWYVIPGLLLLTVFIGLLSGSYPAWFLASFTPVKVLYGKLKVGLSNTIVRSILVIFQFFFSIALIITSMIIYKQINYMLNKDMGFDKEQLMVIRRADALQKKIISFKDEIKKIPDVISITNSTTVPGYPNNNNGYQIEGRSAEQLFMMWTNWVDYDYFDTYKIKLTDGRNFSREFPSDTAAMIINEEAARRFALDDAFNTRFIQPGYTNEEKAYLNILGVSGNFHYQSLQIKIEPHVFMLKPEKWDWAGYLTIRVGNENMDKTIAMIENTWRSFTGDEPFQYFFMDQEFDKFYKEEKRTAKIALAFSFLAIFIACLGLFGLTSFATEQRAREISLRKVLGSTAKSIVLLFTREISILITIATVPAWVISYFFLKNWLQNFSYHIAISPWEFILATVLVLLIALLTVSYRTYRAALVNPAEVLKYE
ncbi:MAG: ABC transporter permease [Bacteroidales bacterium]|nr:ABC transporter permease [Bacteroidales bacterium]